MTKNEYNGWHNYETWLLKLWQDNSEGDQSFWREQAEQCRLAYPESTRTTGCHITARAARFNGRRELYENAAADLAEHGTGVTGFWQDLLSAALSEVNWREIADHWIEDGPPTSGLIEATQTTTQPHP